MTRVAVASLAGSLVGNLLPRLMLHERGVPVSSMEFAKTDANKPYICTVRYPPGKEAASVVNKNLTFFFRYLLAKWTINATRADMCLSSLTRYTVIKPFHPTRCAK